MRIDNFADGFALASAVILVPVLSVLVWLSIAYFVRSFSRKSDR